ncbi:hypothetical protein PF008_g27706 [Phytophthora fragariae]|uniref:Uncharacterized protein n=1 Tax=Phytophthora fragariae TaxID=53985 RepID=A0A6G0QDK2_9STRA|nr:hypothetical protein PF008_g27706 [Phytophthora fragariae]
MKEMSTSTHSAPLRDKRQASGSPFSHSAPYWERCAPTFLQESQQGRRMTVPGEQPICDFAGLWRPVTDDRHFEAATSNRRSHSLVIRCERKD